MSHAHIIVDRQPARGLDARATPILTACGCYWAVCQTHPQAEFWGRSNLIRQGFKAYCPTYITRRRDRALPTLWHQVEAPLFTGYIFVNLGDNEPWFAIRRTPGIRQIMLSSFANPHHVPHGVVEALQATQAARRSADAGRTSWAPGTACRLAAGPMRGHDAVVIGTRDGRTLVGVMCFGAMREVAVATDCLIARD
jgi:transcription antitermination factor NusG